MTTSDVLIDAVLGYGGLILGVWLLAHLGAALSWTLERLCEWFRYGPEERQEIEAGREEARQTKL